MPEAKEEEEVEDVLSISKQEEVIVTYKDLREKISEVTEVTERELKKLVIKEYGGELAAAGRFEVRLSLSSRNKPGSSGPWRVHVTKDTLEEAFEAIFKSLEKTFGDLADY